MSPFLWSMGDERQRGSIKGNGESVEGGNVKVGLGLSGMRKGSVGASALILGAETPEMNIGEVLCRLRCMIDAGKLVVRKK
jgi:hypothetical protein